MIETYTIGDTQYTYEALFNQTPSELAKLYNAIVPEGQKTKRFSDKTAAVKRTWAAIKAQGGSTAPVPAPAEEEKKPVTTHVKPAKAPKEPKAPKPKKEPAERKERGMLFRFASEAFLKKVRAGTNRHKLVTMLYQNGEHWADGATFDQCVAATWGKKENMPEEIQRKTTYEALRLLHYFCGYGMDMHDDGRIYIWSNATKVQEGAIVPKRKKSHRHDV